MRGALRAPDSNLRVIGIIPAYAGSTRVYKVCNAIEEGSSPRMRGAPVPAAPHADRLGIIPAYAGSTSKILAPHSSQRDHPRVCGEHFNQPPKSLLVPGSSPRMRGARAGWCAARSAGRIIPAYAGSTLHEVHRFSSKVQFVYGCQGSVHCSVLQLFIPTGTGRERQIRIPGAWSLARGYLPYFLAALNLLALLQPVGGMPSSLASSVPLGLLISSTPSQSTGSQSG